MTVTKEQYQNYIQLLEQCDTSFDLLNVINDIQRGDYDQKYTLETSYDPFDDYNYPGSKYHYWVCRLGNCPLSSPLGTNPVIL